MVVLRVLRLSLCALLSPRDSFYGERMPVKGRRITAKPRNKRGRLKLTEREIATLNKEYERRLFRKVSW